MIIHRRLVAFVIIINFVILIDQHGWVVAHSHHSHERHHHHERVHHPHDHHGHGDHHGSVKPKKHQRVVTFREHPAAHIKSHTDNMVWVQALLSTALIGLAPILILRFIPHDIGGQNEKSQNILKTLLAYAVGGLLGDVFLHLLPHAMEDHSHGEQGHEHGSSGLWVLTGILLFLVIEKCIIAFSGSSHGHSHEKKLESPDIDHSDSKKANGKARNRHKGSSTNHSVSPDRPPSSPSKKTVAPSAYLNFAADFTHNFTDGLAIGSSFLVDSKTGFVTVVAILLHEIPHEIGDFAILVQAGFSRKAAMRMQIWTAVGALIGTVIGLLAEGVTRESSWILPMTAGGFLYIAMSSAIPELLRPTSPMQSVKEVFAVMMGIAMMATISLFE